AQCLARRRERSVVLTARSSSRDPPRGRPQRRGPVNADEQQVIERCDEVVAEHDPKQSRPAEVLGAQYDAGIAWVDFPEGFGGLGLSPRLQNIVNARLTAAGAPLPYGRNPIGHGMCAPTIVTHGSDE